MVPKTPERPGHVLGFDMDIWGKVIGFLKSKMGHDKHMVIEEVPFEELTLDEYLEISSFDDELE